MSQSSSCVPDSGPGLLKNIAYLCIPYSSLGLLENITIAYLGANNILPRRHRVTPKLTIIASK